MASYCLLRGKYLLPIVSRRINAIKRKRHISHHPLRANKGGKEEG
jgi:hypothetical protein